jgi:UDP-N-acetylmuramate dehydrogenase
MKTLTYHSLKEYNTFGINAAATYFLGCDSIECIQSYLSDSKLNSQPLLVIGGGSNILFTKDFDGLVLKNNIKGIEILSEDSNFVYVKSGAGEVWHDFVRYCIDHNFGGIENLSLIPGSVGAGPMQNIGAYGAELKDVFFELEALNIKTGALETFSKEACHFGYRNSVFKNIYKNQFIILSVTFKLSKNPVYNIAYGAIEAELKKMGIKDLSIQAISEAVCNIRRSKLPDPKTIGNAGSFFKNPEIPESKFIALKKEFPEIVGHQTKENTIKVAAGWLIEKCGFKGKRIDNYGVHKDQALVLVNYGGATGIDIFNLSKSIQETVKNKFEIDLEIEVNIV